MALQKLQLEREIAEEEYRKEQRETERIHALREQRAREVFFFQFFFKKDSGRASGRKERIYALRARQVVFFL